MNDEKGYIMFKGVRNTVVTYDQENRIWTMELVNNPKVFATSTSLFENLLLGASRCDNNDNRHHYFFYLGPHDWTVYNDFFCSGDEGVVKVSLTHCNDAQFTCNDGLCVDINDRFAEFYDIFGSS